MNIQYINKDISHLDRLPQIVTQKPGFYKLLNLLSNYIDESSFVVYDILSKITPIVSEQYSPSIDINYLQRLVDKCGISLQWLVNNASTDIRRQVYFTALQGFTLQRTSTATRENLLNLLSTIFSLSKESTNINIQDGGLNEGGLANMTYSVYIRNFVKAASINYLTSYIKPKITGIRGLFAFETQGCLFSMDYSTNNQAEISVYYNNDWNFYYVESANSLLSMNFDSESGQEVVVANTMYRHGTQPVDWNIGTGYTKYYKLVNNEYVQLTQWESFVANTFYTNYYAGRTATWILELK